MNYLKLFEEHADYENFVSGGTMMKPNVSHCIAENEVHYNPFADQLPNSVNKLLNLIGANSIDDLVLWSPGSSLCASTEAGLGTFIIIGETNMNFGLYHNSEYPFSDNELFEKIKWVVESEECGCEGATNLIFTAEEWDELSTYLDGKITVLYMPD